MRPQVGQVINNKYRLLRVIGDGGMGSVYEARHEVLGTSVALKFLHSELMRRQGLVARFLQEARVSAQIQSPHVVRVTDVDQTPAGAFIVMEYLEGRTLQTLYEDLYHAGLRLSYADALEYAMQMLEGVEAAHRTGIVHRDLKPDNVMITLDAKGRAVLKLLDFGIAKLKVSGDFDRGLTRPGVIMGTPEYMAPEQAFSADAVDARADIFSLGVMIFEMLAGRRPVGGDDPQQIATAYLTGHIARITDLAPEIAPDLAAAVHRAMAPHADGRWETVTALRDAIEPFAVAARAPSALPPSVSLSNPGIARASLAGVMSAQPPRAVPKTFPPDDPPDPAQPAAGHDITSPAEPPVMSGRATPIGGFGADGQTTGEASKFEAGASEKPPPAEANTAPAAVVPPTRSAAPYVPSPAGAAAARPAGTVDDGGATAAVIGDATAFAAPLHLAAPEHSPRPGGTAVGLENPLGGTVPMAGLDAAFSAEAAAPPVVGPPPAPSPFAAKRPTQAGGKSARRRSAMISLPIILLLAGGVSAAVVGGLYLAQRNANVDDHQDPPTDPPPAASVHSDPPASDDPTPPTTPGHTPVHSGPAPTKPQPLKPPPRGSSQPVAPPAPSGSARDPRVPVIPSALGPIVIPSTFPFGFPFGPQQPPRSQPDMPPRGQTDPPPPPPPRRRAPRSEPPGPPPPPPPEEPY
jgi:serine/threonine-protein kinase